MSENPTPLTPEQEARIKAIVQAMLPELTQAVIVAIREQLLQNQPRP